MSDKNNNEKVLIAMSGGVDSSVTALLIKEAGFDCSGATMRLFDHNKSGTFSGERCGQEKDIKDAADICNRIGIEHQVIDLGSDFRENVIDYFIRSYENGQTPNPCVECNRLLKFGSLLKAAGQLGFNRLATGHYARVVYDGKRERWLLKKALDPAKDQSYFLYSLTQDTLSKVLLPLGDYSKAQVRDIAKKYNFENASKAESQDICFVTDEDYSAFIEKYSEKTYPEGNFTDLNGNILGRHKGIIRYTVGQRKGIGISSKKPLYVYDKDPVNNTVTLSGNDELFSRELTATQINLISTETLDKETPVLAKTRYNQKEQPALAIQTAPGTLRVIFDEPQRAIAKGQSVVLYDGDIVIGGGKII